ncbi:MAG: flagellar assembly protein FliH [Sterolibacterium sp.]|nr:flagellar assembly protein FliH [Sterolibacterium sp.]
MSAKNSENKLTAWERWEMANFDPPPAPNQNLPAGEPAITLSTAEEIERLLQEAREKGHATGHAAGYAEGKLLARAEGARLVALTTQFDAALSVFDQQVVEDLLALALDVARQIIRQAIAVKPELLLETIHEALAQMQHPHATIHLHPEDASLVRSYFGDQLAHAGHRIQEDRRLERGGCKIEAGGSQIDASMATRWQRIVASLGSNAEWLAPEIAAEVIENPDTAKPA